MFSPQPRHAKVSVDDPAVLGTCCMIVCATEHFFRTGYFLFGQTNRATPIESCNKRLQFQGIHLVAGPEHLLQLLSSRSYVGLRWCILCYHCLSPCHFFCLFFGPSSLFDHAAVQPAFVCCDAIIFSLLHIGVCLHPPARVAAILFDPFDCLTLKSPCWSSGAIVLMGNNPIERMSGSAANLGRYVDFPKDDILLFEHFASHIWSCTFPELHKSKSISSKRAAQFSRFRDWLTSLHGNQPLAKQIPDRRLPFEISRLAYLLLSPMWKESRHLPYLAN